MSFVPYDDKTNSDVEYTEVNFDELTSCYTYNPLFTAIKSQSKTVKDENNFIQWISPNEEIRFQKSLNEGYLDLIWIYGKPTFNFGSGSKEGTKIVGENEKIKVITKMNLKNYRYVVNQFFTTLIDDNQLYTKYTRDGQTYTSLEGNEKIHGGAYYWLNITNDKTISDIYPVIRYIDTNGEKMLFYPHLITELNTFRNTQSTGLIVNTGGVTESTDNVIYFMMHNIDKSYNYPSLNHQFNAGGDTNITYIWYNDSKNNTQFYPVLSYEKFKEVLALLGVYFRIGGVDYLGYMDSSGQTTGEYLLENDWNKSSQYNSDTINNFTSHEPPYTPPPEDDKSDSIDFGGMYGGGGAFSRFYIMNATELANLRSWMNGVQLSGGDKIPMGLDPMQQIISLSEFPVDISSSGLAPEDIVFRTINVSQDAFGPDVPIPATVNTGVSAIRATGGTIELDLGTVEIPRYWQNKEVPFLDYETSIECYIPFCGVFGLDCQTVMGKTLGAKLYLATATGACNCIVYTNTNGTLNPVAYGSGNMSAQLPISSNQWGTLVAATYEQRMSIAQAQSNSMTNAASALMGGLIGTVSGADMSFGEHVLMGQNIFGSASKTGQSAGSVHIQKQLARNKLQAIGTTFSSAFGTTAAWSLPFKAYVKITRPNAQIPDNYAHTEGIPQVKTKVLRDCQGLTICINTDVTSINATLQEKNMIVEALSNGVIV